MIGIRWSGVEPSWQGEGAEWRATALVTATLFFNIHFWFSSGGELWMRWPALVYAGVVAGVAAVAAALFFAGPAAAAQAAGGSIYGALERAIGAVPAAGVRVGAGAFLALWMAGLMAKPALGWVGWAGDMPGWQVWALTAAMAGYALATGLHGAPTSGKLALFTNKLGFAVLLAAMIRVRDGLPDGLHGLPISGQAGDWGVSAVLFYAAPVCFLAGGLAGRLGGRKQVALAAGAGVAAPLFIAVFMAGLTAAATAKSLFYQPSLNPNVVMALWSQTARSARPGGMLIAAVTLFGALRFGMRAMAETAAPEGGRTPWVWLGAMALAVSGLAAQPGSEWLDWALESCAACLVCAAAAVTCDWLVGGWRGGGRRAVDWAGLAALAVGLGAAPGWVAATRGAWWEHGWVLPSYVATFLALWLGRSVERRWGAARDQRTGW